MQSIKNWIYNNRSILTENVIVGDGTYEKQLEIDFTRPNLTFHGLRYAYSRVEYEKKIEREYELLDARKEVAALLGHGKDAVTRIYLGK